MAESVSPFRVVGSADVRKLLDFPTCIALVRQAMIDLSGGGTRGLPRAILPLDAGHMFGVMTGAMSMNGLFGAKLISVFPENHAKGMSSHQGIVLLFDPVTGAPTASIHAGEITRIRTAAASAVATDVLARKDASTLAILGCGEQGHVHAQALLHVRPIRSLSVWGRDAAKTQAFAAKLSAELDRPVRAAATVEEAVADADIICTTTASPAAILDAGMVRPGTHVNAVGSSRNGPVEIGNALVARSRFFGDHADAVRAQGSEFRNAIEAGLVGDAHFLGEIGQVLAGGVPGRLGDDDVTLYKSLGHIVQDLVSAQFVYEEAGRRGAGAAVAF